MQNSIHHLQRILEYIQLNLVSLEKDNLLIVNKTGRPGYLKTCHQTMSAKGSVLQNVRLIASTAAHLVIKF